MSIGTKLCSLLRDLWRPGQDEQVTDFLILIMGIAGAGKSSFINAFDIVEGGPAKVGHTLQPSTSDIRMHVIDLPNELASEFKGALDSRWVVLVDSPGFDTGAGDSKSLAQITKLVAKQYTRGVTLGSIVYMCDISVNRVNGAARVNVKQLEKMLGESNTFQRVVLVTAAWDEVRAEVGTQREEELCLSFWKELIARGATVKQTWGLHSSDPSGHVEVLRHILQSLGTSLTA
ncbi:hypothetical protein FA15DRAFT_708906 [Coprinopsis marcescibilis]|uniref:G domain-containing protein n=1 Tax=Coprinopsis marcescibilis TaxID=230819 RepID=A0A5C3KH28_COPMA|nr:hypothetical protein FA15DRAFT_708906 [Coprinopsis marcescibilis]